MEIEIFVCQFHDFWVKLSLSYFNHFAKRKLAPFQHTCEESPNFSKISFNESFIGMLRILFESLTCFHQFQVTHTPSILIIIFFFLLIFSLAISLLHSSSPFFQFLPSFLSSSSSSSSCAWSACHYLFRITKLFLSNWTNRPSDRHPWLENKKNKKKLFCITLENNLDVWKICAKICQTFFNQNINWKKKLIQSICFQVKKGYEFESDTDTEVIAKLVKHISDTHPELSFREIIEQATLQLVSVTTHTHTRF